MKYSASKENYLKAIYHLQSEQSTVTTNELAAALQTKPASITDMLKKLKSEKLLIYERYKGFKLNTEGKKVTEKMLIRSDERASIFQIRNSRFELPYQSPMPP